MGTDVRLLEMWNRREKEPNFEEYSELTAEGICESVTRVLEDNNVDIMATVAMGNKTLSQCQMLGIWTKEFGETAELQDGLNDTHWFYALNALAENANGVIISRNTADTLRLKVGDQLSYTRYNSVGNMDAIGSVDATVCAIVDGFPGYERYRYERDEEGNMVEEENYLVVANYATVVSNFKTTPYSVWMRLSEGASAEQVKAFLEEHDISLTSWMSMEEEIAKNKSSALIQITNGMFTMTFFISILICSVGFLIYWIMSIQSREALFGIYRAMGMRMKEIHRMLINEQMFGSLLPILAGGGAGALGTLLFVKLMTLVYLPQKHNISIRISIYGWDMAKLFFVIFAVVLVCFFVLRRLLQRMKIAQALKLGED